MFKLLFDLAVKPLKSFITLEATVEYNPYAPYPNYSSLRYDGSTNVSEKETHTQHTLRVIEGSGESRQPAANTHTLRVL